MKPYILEKILEQRDKLLQEVDRLNSELARYKHQGQKTLCDCGEIVSAEEISIQTVKDSTFGAWVTTCPRCRKGRECHEETD